MNEVSVRSISHHVHEFIVQDLYLMMGREFTLLDQVPAGNIVGMLGEGFEFYKKNRLAI